MYRKIIHMRLKASSTLSLSCENFCSVLIDLCDTSQSIHSIDELVGMITRDFSVLEAQSLRQAAFRVSVFLKMGIPPLYPLLAG